MHMGDPVKSPNMDVGGVLPLPKGKNNFVDGSRENGGAVCGQSGSSAPTNILRVHIGAYEFAVASCRADRVVRPYRTFYEVAVRCANLRSYPARAG